MTVEISKCGGREYRPVCMIWLVFSFETLDDLAALKSLYLKRAESVNLLSLALERNSHICRKHSAGGNQLSFLGSTSSVDDPTCQSGVIGEETDFFCFRRYGGGRNEEV